MKDCTKILISNNFVEYDEGCNHELMDCIQRASHDNMLEKLYFNTNNVNTNDKKSNSFSMDTESYADSAENPMSDNDSFHTGK